jgi:hypothetical protein
VNISQLRSTITTLLSATPDLVGSYTLPDGTKIPAIYVQGRQSVPTEWKVEGLEIAIQEFPSLLPNAAIGKYKQNKQWTVVAVNYDTTSDNLSKAAERLASRFPDARFSFLPESDIAYGQYRITIPDVNMAFLAR